MYSSSFKIRIENFLPVDSIISGIRFRTSLLWMGMMDPPCNAMMILYYQK